MILFLFLFGRFCYLVLVLTGKLVLLYRHEPEMSQLLVECVVLFF
jgi:hypothetical protein